MRIGFGWNLKIPTETQVGFMEMPILSFLRGLKILYLSTEKNLFLGAEALGKLGMICLLFP
jgi:hypothetical protein